MTPEEAQKEMAKRLAVQSAVTLVTVPTPSQRPAVFTVTGTLDIKTNDPNIKIIKRS